MIGTFLYLLRPYVKTLCIETAGALLWKVRDKKGLFTVFWVNTLTNPLLNIILLILSGAFPYYAYRWVIWPMEAVVVLSEGLIYRSVLPEMKHPFLFSLSLNAASYFIGRWI